MTHKHKKPVGLLKRNASTPVASDTRKRKRAKTVNGPEGHPGAGPQKIQPQEPKQICWNCQSEIDRQAAACISKLLAADASKRGGASIKALTLSAHINAKKAVHAVTCQTLQRESGLLQDQAPSCCN